MQPFARHITEGLMSSLSLLAAITAWQAELEFWLRIFATLVAITAGAVTIWSTLRKNRKPEDGKAEVRKPRTNN